MKAASLLLVVLAIVALSACGSDETSTGASGDTTAAKTTSKGSQTTENGSQAAEAGGGSSATTITVRNGEPVGGVQELDYNAGEQVRFTVRSDVADEVHVHGYDVSEEIPAEGSATLSFPADLEGIYEVELHESEQQIAELRVNP